MVKSGRSGIMFIHGIYTSSSYVNGSGRDESLVDWVMFWNNSGHG